MSESIEEASYQADESPDAPLGDDTAQVTERATVRPFERFVAWLTRPAPQLIEAEARRRAQLLAGLMLCLIPLGTLAIIIFAMTRNKTLDTMELVQQSSAIGLLIVSYLLSRTPRYRLAAILSAVVMIAGNWLALSHEHEPSRVIGYMGMTITGVLVSSVILSVRTTVIISLINLAAITAIPYIHPSITMEAAAPAIWTFVFLNALIFLVGAIVNQDLHDLQTRGAQLEESEERYTLAAAAANDALWDWNRVTDHVYYSPRWFTIIGLEQTASDTSLTGWFNRIHPEDIDQVRSELQNHVDGHSPAFATSHRVRTVNGQWRWIHARGLAVRNSEGVTTRIAGSLSDITPQKKYEEQLIHDALHDALTGLPNRVLLLERLQQCVARASRIKDDLFAILFLDIDRFKLVNDSLGHNAGDQLLICVAERLEHCVRPADTVARLGGDEFIILLEAIAEPDGAKIAAERICEILSQEIDLNGESISTTVSIGYVTSDQEYSIPEDLLRDADTALYQAKKSRHSPIQKYAPGMHQTAVIRLQLESELRNAIDKNQLFLVFQPIVDLSNLGVTGFEASLRWRHPTHGLISPVDFIPVAEETGFIQEIDKWVLKTACAQQARWRDLFGTERTLAINVNLSGHEFQSHTLPIGVKEIVEQANLDPHDLQIELTETVVMDQAERSQRALASLRTTGIRICVDDFGTGYSSLSYLNAFDIDGLKIDRSFVNSIRQDKGPPKIIQAIIDLGHNLGLQVTAEGVETKHQLNKLIELECDYAQGFYLARPMGAVEAEALLRAEKPLG